ncbi:MAG: permease [Calditrichaeota bacterium]|nr:permease [Calditrichota bacterium]
MNWREEYKPLLWISGFFLFAYFMPVSDLRFDQALKEAFALAHWYAREHVLLCLVPAFFIAGVIAVFVSQAAIVKYFGAAAPKWISYLVASISGTILAVCSCTVLPLFSGIHKRGAGLGPAIAFLYSGPAINILAIILTARILGLELGVARVVGAVFFSMIIGLAMHLIYRKEEAEKAASQLAAALPEETRPIWQTTAHFFVLVAILVFATWGAPDVPSGGFYAVYLWKWWLVAFFSILLAVSLVIILKIRLWQVTLAALPVVAVSLIFSDQPLIPFTLGVVSLSVLLSFSPGEPEAWMQSSWDFAKQILPLLGAGVLMAGFLLGSPESGQGIIPTHWIADAVGGNSIAANLFASVAGAFMYFATLTEVPILQGLINSGMGKGPALALLLAGPALSLPNMLVIRGVIGTQKTVVYVALVVVMATISGILYGSWFS